MGRIWRWVEAREVSLWGKGHRIVFVRARGGGKSREGERREFKEWIGRGRDLWESERPQGEERDRIKDL